MEWDELIKEIKFKTTRSSGAGGQHVNKVATKVELRFHIDSSDLLDQQQKDTITIKLLGRINNDGELILHCDETRSQLKNKEIVFKRFIELIKEALKPIKKRKPSKPGKSAIKKRLDAKKKHSQKKDSRRFNPHKD